MSNKNSLKKLKLYPFISLLKALNIEYTVHKRASYKKATEIIELYLKNKLFLIKYLPDVFETISRNA